MNSPAPNVPYNLTVAKVKASERPADYEALEPVEPAKATFRARARGPRRSARATTTATTTAKMTMTTTKRWTSTTTTCSSDEFAC